MVHALPHESVVFKTVVRIKMLCVNINLKASRGRMKEVEDDPNQLPDFDLVRFLPTQVVGTIGNPRESLDEKSRVYRILPCMYRGKPADFLS